MKKTAALHNLGCKVNAYETEAMEQQLEAAGYEIVGFGQRADVYVVNTCTVTNVADKKSRQMLHRARRLNPEGILVAAGCFAQTSGDYLREEGIVDIIIGNNQKGQLVPLLEEYEKSRKKAEAVLDLSHEKLYEDMRLSTTLEHTRAFIKIQDGCNQFCSYCIIPYARGRVRSRRPESILEEVWGLVGQGYREVVLTGIHLSSYGVDFRDRQPDLLAVIRQLHEIPGLERIRLGSLEPRIITEAFVQELRSFHKVCPHFHLSLQSGCDDTLRRMNRHYTTAEYLEKCQLLRRFYSHPAITTDVITGFPGETDEEFGQTLDFVERAGFYEIHVFPFSPRKGTKAEKMPAQVPEAVKKSRSAQLLELTRKMSRQFRDDYRGQEMEALLEEELELNGRRYMVGHTKEYVRCAFEAGEKNTIVSGIFTDFLQDGVALCRAGMID